MNQEVRFRLKHVIIFLSIIGFLFFYSLSSNRDCESEQSSRSNGDGADAWEAGQGRDAFLPNRRGPTIYAVTPTYSRPVQKAELTRLSHVIRLVPNVFWVIVEDASQTSSLVTNLLRRNGLQDRSVQLFAKTPTNFKLKGKDPNWLKPRGVEQRNEALRWIRNRLKHDSLGDGGTEQSHSIVYFMDDDNTYSTELFEEISKIERGKVGVWPVGLVGGLMVEKPVLNRDGLVLGFNSAWKPERPFPLDMAGFAISSDLLLENPQAQFSYEVERGYQESEILRHLTIAHDMQPLANQCKDVLVWHTRTETPKLDAEKTLQKSGKISNDGMEV
uniref:Galactosylgalactosylxylosylprotein 3-beta-glucuronosyltransferase n=1 Tax=Anopheles epiroticus TaxID=199890 RepID=A0A182PQM9_9DIPT